MAGVPNIFATQSGNVPASQLDANFAAILATSISTTTFSSFFATSTVTAASILNDNQLTVNSGDCGAVRGFATSSASNAGVSIRGVEAVTSVPSGGTLTIAYGIEIGLHSQVAGTGKQTIGASIASGHTGWLPSGVRNDIGLFVQGEDGWKLPILCQDTDGSTVLMEVTQTGGIFAKEKVWVQAAGPSSTIKYGILVPSQAPVGETWCGLFYDSVNNIGRLEAITQGTANRGIAIASQGGSVLIGSTTDDASGAALQVYGFGRFAAGTAIPAGGSTAASIRIGITPTALAVYVGSGAPTVSANQGSLYLRSDGSSTSTRMYVNTNGSTGWTAVTTAT